MVVKFEDKASLQKVVSNLKSTIDAKLIEIKAKNVYI